MNKEIDSFEQNMTWDLVLQPENLQVLTNRCDFNMSLRYLFS